MLKAYPVSNPDFVHARFVPSASLRDTPLSQFAHRNVCWKWNGVRSCDMLGSKVRKSGQGSAFDGSYATVTAEGAAGLFGKAMSRALNILQGRFGRVALLDMDCALVTHAHRACHVLLKFGGADTAFQVRDQLCPLEDRTAVLVNAWEPHAYIHAPNAPQTIILALYIDPLWLARIDRQLVSSGHSQFFPRRSVALNSNVLERALNLGTQMLLGDPFSREDAEEIVFDLTISIIDSFSDRVGLRGEAAADHRIRRATDAMRGQVGDPLDVGKLARIAGLSRPHFFHQFKQVTGLTPALFLNTLRMEEATKKLADEARPLLDVAQDIGFEAHSNFTRFFRQHQGVAPSEYRRVTQFFE